MSNKTTSLIDGLRPAFPPKFRIADQPSGTPQAPIGLKEHIVLILPTENGKS